MSFDIFYQRFDGGEAGEADETAVLGVLEPLIAERGDGSARICTSDGDADVYGINDPASGHLMVNHAIFAGRWGICG